MPGVSRCRRLPSLPAERGLVGEHPPPSAARHRAAAYSCLVARWCRQTDSLWQQTDRQTALVQPPMLSPTLPAAATSPHRGAAALTQPAAAAPPPLAISLLLKAISLLLKALLLFLKSVLPFASRRERRVAPERGRRTRTEAGGSHPGSKHAGWKRYLK